MPNRPLVLDAPSNLEVVMNFEQADSWLGSSHKQAQALPSDAKDEEWAFVAPYLTLMTEDAPQRTHSLREVYDVLKWVVKTGSPWRYLPGDSPPWEAVYQRSCRWLEAGVFEQMAHDLRAILGLAQGRQAVPSASVMDGKVLQGTPESGAPAGYDGQKRRANARLGEAGLTTYFELPLLN